MTDAQTEARSIAQTSLWIPAKPEHAKIGWTYDFEQTERIARAAYDSAGYDAPVEVVEFVMAEADRRHRAALAAKDAELAEARADALKVGDQMLAEKFRADRAEASLAEARKALEPFALVAEHDIGEDEADSDAFRPMPKPFNHAPQITVGHLRAALAVLREAK